jgi:hypothetical protein
MRPVRVTLSAVGVSTPIILDTYRNPFNVGIGVTVSGGSTLSFTAQVTYDDVFSNTFNPSTAQWFAVSGLNAQGASANGLVSSPVTAIRLSVADPLPSGSFSGSATMTVIQAGMPGS